MVIDKEKSFKCPHCGEVHKEYVLWGAARSPMCTKCNKLIGKDLVPEKYIKHLPSKKRKKKEIKPKEEKEKEVKRKGKKKTSLFVTPKSPHEILEEVLREFGCNEFFIKAMVRRSKRLGGMHPGNLRNYLSTMRSGIGTRDQAAFVAEEYRFALDEERDKASRIGYKTAYPLEERRYEKYERPSEVRRKGYYAEYPEEKYARSHKEPYKERKERGERISRGDVREMVEDLSFFLSQQLSYLTLLRDKYGYRRRI